MRLMSSGTSGMLEPSLDEPVVVVVGGLGLKVTPPTDSVAEGDGVGVGWAIVMVACADAVPQSLVEPSVATLMCVVTTAPGALLPTVKL